MCTCFSPVTQHIGNTSCINIYWMKYKVCVCVLNIVPLQEEPTEYECHITASLFTNFLFFVLHPRKVKKAKQKSEYNVSAPHALYVHLNITRLKDVCFSQNEINKVSQWNILSTLEIAKMSHQLFFEDVCALRRASWMLPLRAPLW